MVQSQGILPPVSVTRILAGEGTGQFSGSLHGGDGKSVPISVALPYIGGILDEDSKTIINLKVSCVNNYLSSICTTCHSSLAV